MRALLAAIVAAALGAIVWGTVISGQTPPSRIGARVAAAGPDWYAALPSDPGAATEAYLRRVAPEARARGDAFGATRALTYLSRIAVLLASLSLIMFSGAAARMRDVAGRRLRGGWLRDALVALQLFAALFLLNLPMETYAGFVRYRLAGLSRQTYFGWLSDIVLGWASLTIFSVVGAVAIMALIRRRPRSWPGWATAVYFVLASFYILVLPQYIEPLLNRVTPLVDGPGKEAILSLARANGVPADDVFVRDASKQGVLLNAHVSGLGGTARIVLDDNAVANASGPEFRWLMAHEIGHYVLAHIPKQLVFETLSMGAGFLCIGFGLRRLIARFGSRWNVPSPADTGALPVFWGLFLLWGFLALPVSNGISRQQEAEADNYGINASQEPLGQAEFMIHDADAYELAPSAFEEWLLYDHPSPRNRILAAMRWRAEHLPGP
jgi:STE24 endopeptidase